MFNFLCELCICISLCDQNAVGNAVKMSDHQFLWGFDTKAKHSPYS